MGGLRHGAVQEMGCVNHLGIKQDSAFYGMTELPDIAGPIVGEQIGLRGLGEPLGTLL
jgi:hypothetical protein